MSDNETPRSRRAFRITLAVLFVIAVAWNLFHVLNPGRTLFVPEQAPALAPQPDTKRTENPLPMPSKLPALHSGPGWRGVVRVEKGGGDASKITIYSVVTYGAPGKLTSFQIWAPDAEGKEQDITAQFTSNGKEELTGELKAKGRVPLRVRLHREESTLEFTELLDLP